MSNPMPDPFAAILLVLPTLEYHCSGCNKKIGNDDIQHYPRQGLHIHWDNDCRSLISGIANHEDISDAEAFGFMINGSAGLQRVPAATRQDWEQHRKLIRQITLMGN